MPRIGLDVPVFAGTENQRPLRGVDARRRREDEGRAAPGLDADGRHARQSGYRVDPRARGVEHHRRFVRGAAGSHLPSIVRARDGRHLGIAHQPPAGPSHAAQVALVDGMHVHVGGIGFVHGTGDLFGPQHRHARQRLVAAQAARVGRHRAQYVPVRVEQAFLAGCPDHQGATRRQQRMFGEACRRVLQKVAARLSERAHLRRAVAFHEERRRAAGRVIAGLRFPFEHGHAAVRGKPVGDRSTCDAAADDEKVALRRARRKRGWHGNELCGFAKAACFR